MRRLGRRGPDVRRLRRRGDVDGLGAALRYQDWLEDRNGRLLDVGVKVRLDAARALGELGGEAAAQTLAGALYDREPKVRETALHVLAEAAEPGAGEAVARAVAAWRGGGADGLRDHALRVLVEWEDARLGMVFAEALVDQHDLEALDAADQQAVRRLFGVTGGPAAAASMSQRLAPRLRSDDAAERRRVQQVLASLADGALDSLIDALERPETRQGAAATLGAIRDARAVPALLQMLDSPETELRATAARALGSIRDPQAAEGLIRATADEAVEVRDAAQEALDQLGAVGVLVGVAAAMRPLADRVERIEQGQEELRRTLGGGAERPSLHAGDPAAGDRRDTFLRRLFGRA